MRKYILILLFLVTLSEVHAQSDSTRRHAIIWGMGTGAGFHLTETELGSGYEQLVFGPKAYCQFTTDLTVLWKEQIGFRLSFGRVGRFAGESGFTEFVAANYPGYQFLPDYSTVSSGFAYTYFCPQFAYRIGSEPFNVSFFGGIGFGKMHLPRATAYIQETGTNNHKRLTYLPTDKTNMHVNLHVEFGYMRQLNQHWFSNFGIYANCVAINANYSFVYSEQEFNQPIAVFVPTNPKYFHATANVGVFLNFQWNKRESPRAIYE